MKLNCYWSQDERQNRNTRSSEFEFGSSEYQHLKGDKSLLQQRRHVKWQVGDACFLLVVGGMEHHRRGDALGVCCRALVERRQRIVFPALHFYRDDVVAARHLAFQQQEIYFHALLFVCRCLAELPYSTTSFRVTTLPPSICKV